MSPGEKAGCSLYMCLPSVVGGQRIKFPLDGVTQIPVTVYYDLGSTEVDPDELEFSLVAYQDGQWIDGTPVSKDMDLSELGWQLFKEPGKDVLPCKHGCDSVPWSGDKPKPSKVLFYLQYPTFGGVDEVQSYKDNNKNSADFQIGVSLTYKGQVWSTASTEHPVDNSTYRSVTLTLCDGTPSVSIQFYFSGGNNTIVCNDSMQIPITTKVQIYTPPGNGGSGAPLSSQDSATIKLVQSANGDDLDGYCPNHDISLGSWKVTDTGADTGSFSEEESACTGLKHDMSGKHKEQVFYVSHTNSVFHKQVVRASVRVSYTPPGSCRSIVWGTDSEIASPEEACLAIYAIARR